MLVAALSILSLGTVRRLLGVQRRPFYQGVALVAALLAAAAVVGEADYQSACIRDPRCEVRP